MYQKDVLSEINKIKMSLMELEKRMTVFGDWIPKKTVQKFFDYSDTQMRDFEKEQGLVFSKIKSRKFYSMKSIILVIEKYKFNN